MVDFCDQGYTVNKLYLTRPKYIVIINTCTTSVI